MPAERPNWTRPMVDAAVPICLDGGHLLGSVVNGGMVDTPQPRHHLSARRVANLAGRAVGATERAAAAAAVGGVTRFVTREVVSSVAPGAYDLTSSIRDQFRTQERQVSNRGSESSVYALERHRIDPAGDARRHARAGRHPRRIIVAGPRVPPYLTSPSIR